MLTRLWANLFPKRKETLADILSDKSNRESLLGVLNQIAPSRDQIEKDAIRFINYSNSKDYAIFSKEVWSNILNSLDHLMKTNVSDRDIDFYRGKLASSVDLLRISFLARNAKERIEQERKEERKEENIVIR